MFVLSGGMFYIEFFHHYNQIAPELITNTCILTLRQMLKMKWSQSEPRNAIHVSFSIK